jgi:hypothetical protein
MKLVWPENTRDYVQVLTDLGEFGFWKLKKSYKKEIISICVYGNAK